MAAFANWRFYRYAQSVWQNSPWVVFAVTFHVILGAALSIFSWKEDRATAELGAFAIAPARATEAPLEIPEPEPLIERTPPPIEDHELVTPDEAIVPYEPDLAPNLADPIGDPNSTDALTDFSPSSSTNIGPGGPGRYGPTSPFSPKKGKGTAPPGRTPIAAPHATEEAVLFGLRWLVRHQQADGAWSIAKLGDVCADATCRATGRAYTEHYDEGLTALALLAFLGAGHSHASQAWIVDDVKGERHRVGEVVRNGLRWLTEHQKDDGSFGATKPFLYNEALCAMALSEAYWLTGARGWRDSAQRAVDFLVAGQKRDPHGAGAWGWRYAPRDPVTITDPELDPAAYAAEHESDLSVSTWAAMALKSAELAGLDVPRESVDGALAFARWVSLSNGRAGYLTPDGAGLAVSGEDDHFTYHPAAMSALAMCSRTFLAHDPSDPFLEAGARELLRDLPTITADRLSIDYYYWYYGSLALYQFDGPDSPRRGEKYWKPWNTAMSEALVGLQSREPRTCGHGAWLVPDRWSYTGGPLYATALNVLTLEVYYRYDNAFGVRAERPKQATERK